MTFRKHIEGAKYVGESCTGCKTFKKYRHFIEVTIIVPNNICASCTDMLPKHIPKDQHKRYLDRIFRKELNNEM